MPKPRKGVSAGSRAEMLKFLATATSGSFGMVIFYQDPNDPENFQVANLYKHVPELEASEEIINSAHAMYQLYQNYDVEELHEMLLDRGVMCFGTETDGEA